MSFTPGSYLDLGLGVAYVEDISRSWCDSPDWRDRKHNIPHTLPSAPSPPHKQNTKNRVAHCTHSGDDCSYPVTVTNICMAPVVAPCGAGASVPAVRGTAACSSAQDYCRSIGEEEPWCRPASRIELARSQGKDVLLAPFSFQNTIVLPRQARDNTHGKLKTRPFSPLLRVSARARVPRARAIRLRLR